MTAPETRNHRGVVQPGTRFEIDHPFYLASHQEPDTGAAAHEWAAGVTASLAGDDANAYADALGKCIYVVVSMHKPPGWGKRVFYTRTYLTPDGQWSGGNRLLVASLGHFRRLVRGYGQPFVLRTEGARS